MSAGKRMGLAFGCMLLAILVFGLLGTIGPTLRFGIRYALPTLQMLPVFLLFAFPGWLLALPFVLLIRDAEGFRAWLILVLGSAIGPAVLLTWTLLATHGTPVDWNANGSAVLMAFVIGLLTTLFYIALLKRFHGSRRKPIDTAAAASEA
jgi:hypothetical protein